MAAIFVAVFNTVLSTVGRCRCLVVVAWSILAAAFAPLITLLALGFSLNERKP